MYRCMAVIGQGISLVCEGRSVIGQVLITFVPHRDMQAD